MTLTYSRGFGIHDTTPENRTAPDFAAFCDAIMGDRATAKGEQWIASAFNGNRCADNAQPRRWISLDLDGVTPDEFAELLRALGECSALVYTTARSTPERPRARVIVELAFAADRAGTRVTSKRLRESLGASLAWDASCDKAEQPLFTPLHASQHWRFTGRPVVPVPTVVMVPSVPIAAAGPAHPIACRLAEQDLEHALDDLRNASPGNRNNLLAAVSDRIGGYVAAVRLNGDAARAKLIEATGAWGEPEKTARTIDRQINHGKRSPLAMLVPDVDRSPIPSNPADDNTTLIRNAADLMRRVFPPTQWAIRDILPEGVTILSGAPKSGKSFLVLQWAYAIATGCALWDGRTPEAPGRVLYLALEDKDQRMQERIAGVKLDRSAPYNIDLSRLDYAVEWSQAEKGVEQIQDYLRLHPDCRMVVVDTISTFRTTDPGRKSAYAMDYDVGKMFKPLGREFNVAVVLVAHTRKESSDDPMQQVSGTNGLTGSVDNVLVLEKAKRGADHSILHVDGRDIKDPAELAIQRRSTGFWACMGKAADVARSAESKAVLDALEAIGHIGSARQIQNALAESVKIGTLRMRLSRMVKRGEIQRTALDDYCVPSFSSELPPVPDITPPTPGNV